MAPRSEQRRQALEELLASETFRRADQLKRLLVYLTEQEELGRTHEVTEYEIGTRALGRGADFAPETDSSVRTRMHGLRQKLEEHYRSGASSSALQLEIPKGTYRPTFRPVAVAEPVQETRRIPWAWIAVPLVCIVMARFAWRTTRPTPLETLWKPLLDSVQTPALLVAQPLHLWVRDVQGQAFPMQYQHLPDLPPDSPQFQT